MVIFQANDSVPSGQIQSKPQGMEATHGICPRTGFLRPDAQVDFLPGRRGQKMKIRIMSAHLRSLAAYGIFAVCGLVAASMSSAQAQTYRNVLAGLTAVELKIVDDVKDGCLPRPKALTQTVELELRRSNILIDEGSGPILEVHVLGHEQTFVDGESTGECAVATTLTLFDCGRFKFSWQSGPQFKCVIVWSKDGLNTGKKPMQNQVQNMVGNLARDFVLDLERDRSGV